MLGIDHDLEPLSCDKIVNVQPPIHHVVAVKSNLVVPLEAPYLTTNRCIGTLPPLYRPLQSKRPRLKYLLAFVTKQRSNAKCLLGS